MSTAVRSTPSLSVPQTQNTAPVLEFNCLYTHDLRRKQKRWQDGFLRYHTFNKRVMVYDVPRNLVGDMHWKGDVVLQEGDEMTLDKGGALVQVADSVGRTETDLTELLNSARKTSSNKGSSPIKAPHPSARPTTQTAVPRQQIQSKHRSLNALLEAPRGPLGKAALPAKSPFEQRHKGLENSEWESGRPPKRPRIENAVQWPVHRPTIHTKVAARPELPLWARTADTATNKKSGASGEKENRQHNIISLVDDEPGDDGFLPGFSSDALDRFSSPQHATPARKPQIVESSSPGFQTCQKPPRESARLQAIPSEMPPPQLAPPKHTPRNANDMPQSGPTLRLTSTAPKKKMLLCQNQIMKRSKNRDTVHSFQDRSREIISDEAQIPRPKTAREKLEERLARINSKNAGRVNGSPNRSHSPEQPTTELQQAIDILAHRPDRLAIATEAIPETEHEQTYQIATGAGITLPREDQTSVKNPEAPHTKPPARTTRILKPPLGVPNNVPERSHTAPPSPSRFNAATKPAQSKFNPRLKKSLQRAVSLNTAASGTSTVLLSKPFRPPAPPFLGDRGSPVETIPPPPPDAWSREAFDLFDWRPPGWDEDGWKIEGNEVRDDGKG